MWKSILESVLKVIIDKCFDWVTMVYAEIALKKGINIKAEKNIEHIDAGDAALSEGNIAKWLEQLNKEQS